LALFDETARNKMQLPPVRDSAYSAACRDTEWAAQMATAGHAETADKRAWLKPLSLELDARGLIVLCRALLAWPGLRPGRERESVCRAFVALGQEIMEPAATRRHVDGRPVPVSTARPDWYDLLRCETWMDAMDPREVRARTFRWSADERREFPALDAHVRQYLPAWAEVDQKTPIVSRPFDPPDDLMRSILPLFARRVKEATGLLVDLGRGPVRWARHYEDMRDLETPARAAATGALDDLAREALAGIAAIAEAGGELGAREAAAIVVDAGGWGEVPPDLAAAFPDRDFRQETIEDVLHRMEELQHNDGPPAPAELTMWTRRGADPRPDGLDTAVTEARRWIVKEKLARRQVTNREAAARALQGLRVENWPQGPRIRSEAVRSYKRTEAERRADAIEQVVDRMERLNSARNREEGDGLRPMGHIEEARHEAVEQWEAVMRRVRGGARVTGPAEACDPALWKQFVRAAEARSGS
jgi:hypothetical protein